MIDDCTLDLDADTRILTDEERQLPIGKENVGGTAFDFRKAASLSGRQVDHAFTGLSRDGDGLAWTRLIAPDGRLPVNTSGGNLAEGFVHGMSLVTEAVRQIRGTSVNQVPGARLSLMTGGPGDGVVSSALLGSADTL